MIDSAEALIAPTTTAVTKIETPLRRFVSDFFESKVAVAASIVFGTVV
jgi:hypothetical protein